MDPVKAQANLMQSTAAHFNSKQPAGVHQHYDDGPGYVGGTKRTEDWTQEAHEMNRILLINPI